MMPAKPLPGEVDDQLRPYIEALPDGGLFEVLAEQRLELLEALAGLGEHHGPISYAPGKWTLSRLLGHLADTETVLLYRVLRAARRDATAVPGFDENHWAAGYAPGVTQAFHLLLARRDFTMVELRSMGFGFWEQPLQAEGVTRSAGELAWMIPGHAAHHLAVLRERYQPLLPPLEAPCLELDPGGGIRLRDLRLSDSGPLFRLTVQNREHLGEWLNWVPGIQSEADTRHFIMTAREAWLRTGRPVLAIEQAGELLGLIDLHGSRMSTTVSIGYWLSKAATGGGIVTRACGCLIDYAFRELKTQRLEIHCAVDNLPSRAIPERLGVPLEGVQRNMQQVGDRLLDLAMYAVIREDWLSKD